MPATHSGPPSPRQPRHHLFNDPSPCKQDLASPSSGGILEETCELRCPQAAGRPLSVKSLRFSDPRSLSWDKSCRLSVGRVLMKSTNDAALSFSAVPAAEENLARCALICTAGNLGIPRDIQARGAERPIPNPHGGKLKPPPFSRTQTPEKKNQEHHNSVTAAKEWRKKKGNRVQGRAENLP